MLLTFKVQNFRSFNSQQELSLAASNYYEEDLPENVIEHSLPGLSEVRFLSCAAIYGANASGKTNLLRALQVLRNYVVKSFQVDVERPTCADPFKLKQSCQKEPTRFEIQFSTDIRYKYILSVTPKRVIEESLVAYPKGAPQQWFERKWNPQTERDDWKFPNAKVRTGLSAISGRTRHNVAFLSKAADDKHAKLQAVYQWFEKTLRSLNFGDGPLSPTFTIGEVSTTDKKKQFLALLATADFNIVDLDVEEKELSEEELKKRVRSTRSEDIKSGAKEADISSFKLVSVAFSHKGEGENVKMDFISEESNGTKRYFALLGPWLDILENGYTVLIDELETCLHPLLVVELIKLFSSKLNTKGAQLIFTTHNPLFLDETLLRRDQIWFTEKERDGATHLYPLTDYAPRKGEALMKGYLAGRYGGIPFIPNGLIPNE